MPPQRRRGRRWSRRGQSRLSFWSEAGSGLVASDGRGLNPVLTRGAERTDAVRRVSQVSRSGPPTPATRTPPGRCWTAPRCEDELIVWLALGPLARRPFRLGGRCMC